jgi:hypothetical protein
MKKTCILLIFTLVSLVFTSCIAVTVEEQIDDVKTPVTDIDKSIPEKIEYSYSVTARDYASIDALSLEERANEFVSALCLKDTEVLEMYIGGKINNLDSVKMDAYVKSIEEGIAQVGVTVYESEAAGFPVGEHEYILDLNQNGVCYVCFFNTTEKFTEFNKQLKSVISEDTFIQDGYDFSRFSIRLGGINKIDIYHNAKHTRPDLEYPLTDLETFSKYLYDRFGIEDLNDYPQIKDELYQNRRFENGEEKFFVDCANGAAASPWIFEGYTVDGNKYSYTFTFYSDFAYISPTQKVTYSFEKRDDCHILTFTEIITEKLGEEEVSVFAF